MPRVHHVQRARKAIESAGVAVGDAYYWWKFRYGGKHVSKTPPKQSQLTQSEFLSTMYDLQDRIASLDSDLYAEDPDCLSSDLSDIASEIRELGEEQESRRSNMPDSLQDSDTGTLLQERADGCESWADALESVEIEQPDREDFIEDTTDEFLESLGILDENGDRNRDLTDAETAELEARIDEAHREACVDATQSAIQEAIDADPGIG